MLNRLFATTRSSRRWKLALLVAGLASLALAGGIAYAASGDTGSILNACAKTDNGQLRLDTGSGCLPSEQAVQLAQPQDRQSAGCDVDDDHRLGQGLPGVLGVLVLRVHADLRRAVATDQDSVKER
jgi:hypothetical protein